MKIGFSRVFACLVIICFFTSVVLAQSNVSLWRDLPSGSLTPDERSSLPDTFRSLRLDLPSFKALLDQSIDENKPGAFANGPLVSLPLSNGAFATFRVASTVVMHPQLAAKFPSIRTFVGRDIENPLRTVRMDYTQWGFHAMIMSPEGWTFIDPASRATTSEYICYARSSSHRVTTFICETGGAALRENNSSPSSERSSGTQLRTYRLALACTGEYAAFFGGTVSGAMSGMVTSVNRVDAVYEMEVSVSLELIPNNDVLVFTNASTDPYTNNNGSTMLGENQTRITSAIGSANYDIGHVFSTGGGGVAGLGVVCNSSNKARGVTGSSAPTGDSFDIDYVAHEMGHQFSGNHTFNGNAGSCTSNRSSSAAYEPGSGTTIMAYAGICGSANNTASNSDPIFHTKSFDEINIFTTTGSGNTCAVSTATGNTAPVAIVGQGYTIPYLTSFVLTGSATDANGDPLTYLWEEYDLGPQGAPNSPSGNAPLFRDFVPTASPSRTFPRITDIVRNTQTLGELLPTYARSLQFRFTARDNRTGGGGVMHSDTAITLAVINTADTFKVTYPNTNVTLIANQPATITWKVASTNLSPINTANVNILLSVDSGYTFPYTLVSNVPNDGSETVTIPNIISSRARIKVEAVGNIFFDMSNVNFTITSGSGVLTSITTNPLTATSHCAGSTIAVSYNVNGPANAGNIFTAQLSAANGSFSSPQAIGSISSTGSGTINALIPAGISAGTQYRIRVVSSSPAVTGSDNGANLQISSPVSSAGNVTGPSTVCQGQSGVLYSVAPVVNASQYNWTLPAGASITSGLGTNSITVSFSSSAVSGNVSVKGFNDACGEGPASPLLPITVNPLPGQVGTITGPATICPQQQNVSFSIMPLNGATGYQWTVPSQASIVSGQNTTAIDANFNLGAVSDYITVSAVNSCGMGNITQLPVTILAEVTARQVTAASSTDLCTGETVQLSFPGVANQAFQWRKNGIAIAGAIGTSYLANSAGSYDVVSDSIRTFQNTNALAIPENTCVHPNDTITVSGYTGAISTSGICVKINITHPYTGDLELILEAPNGDLLGLSDNRGGSGDNFVNTVFTDSAATQLPATGAPYTGHYKPYGSLISSCVNSTRTSFGAIGGGSINPNGKWILHVYDLATQDLGTVDNWSISFPASATSPCPVFSNIINVTQSGAPAITSISPSSGSAGTSVMITGNNFTAATAVTFNGIAASSFVVNSPFQITAIAPSGVTTGPVSVQTKCGSAASASNFSVTATVTINLKVFIEGMYVTGGGIRNLMTFATSDTVTIELHNSTSPFALAAPGFVKQALSTTGNGSFVFPSSAMGNSYYLVVKHRNSLETWSAAPVLLNSSVISYDFTTAANKAYGNKLHLTNDGRYTLYSGDIDRNGVVNLLDVSLLQNSATVFGTGYVAGDLTGDGSVESSDFSLIENNAALNISLSRP